jgi:CDGSH iron-sulfur domain-containing protein 3
MTETQPVIAQRSPYAVAVEAGNDYWWCSCGKSSTQPFCSGAHKGGPFSPLKLTAAKTETVYLCGCKHTTTPPGCDGTHKKL